MLLRVVATRVITCGSRQLPQSRSGVANKTREMVKPRSKPAYKGQRSMRYSRPRAPKASMKEVSLNGLCQLPPICLNSHNSSICVQCTILVFPILRRSRSSVLIACFKSTRFSFELFAVTLLPYLTFKNSVLLSVIKRFQFPFPDHNNGPTQSPLCSFAAIKPSIRLWTRLASKPQVAIWSSTSSSVESGSLRHHLKFQYVLLGTIPIGCSAQT